MFNDMSLDSMDAQPRSGANDTAPGMAPEQVLFHGHTHAKILVKPITAQILLLTAHLALVKYLPGDLGSAELSKWVPLVLHGLLVIGEFWYAIMPFLRWWFARFEVTDRRVRMRWGVLYKNSREIHLDRITQVAEERGILDRLWGAGTLVIHDAANSNAIRFHDVPKFKYVRQTLDDARHAAHLRLGQVHQSQWPGDPR